jgi:hypothetical protein
VTGNREEEKKNRRGRKKTEETKLGISFNHLFTIFNNSSASRNPDRRRTPVDLTREDAELQNRERRSIRKKQRGASFHSTDST